MTDHSGCYCRSQRSWCQSSFVLLSSGKPAFIYCHDQQEGYAHIRWEPFFCIHVTDTENFFHILAFRKYENTAVYDKNVVLIIINNSIHIRYGNMNITSHNVCYAIFVCPIKEFSLIILRYISGYLFTLIDRYDRSRQTFPQGHNHRCAEFPKVMQNRHHNLCFQTESKESPELQVPWSGKCLEYTFSSPNSLLSGDTQSRWSNAATLIFSWSASCFCEYPFWMRYVR